MLLTPNETFVLCQRQDKRQHGLVRQRFSQRRCTFLGHLWPPTLFHARMGCPGPRESETLHDEILIPNIKVA